MWQMAVGPAVARVTTVDLANGVLTVRCADDRWLSEVTRARPMILERLQQILGPDVVKRLDIRTQS